MAKPPCDEGRLQPDEVRCVDLCWTLGPTLQIGFLHQHCSDIEPLAVLVRAALIRAALPRLAHAEGMLKLQEGGRGCRVAGGGPVLWAELWRVTMQTAGKFRLKGFSVSLSDMR
ncbi:MAG: hypothetical protein QNK18_06915 [Gammaproteobacteria bacterium]|nr:hypothetical protein [Gammaproteobacteria bacterium]